MNITELKSQFEMVFIPAIEDMINKETTHLQSLRKRTMFFRTSAIEQFILNSESRLKHLHHRLNQYKDYAEKLTNSKILKQ